MTFPALAPEMILRRLAVELPRYRFSFLLEADLHRGVSEVLERLGLPFEHEFIAGPGARFDFFIADTVVVEVKVAGSLPEAFTQVNRYCALESVGGVAVVNSSGWGRRAKYCDTFNGKPVRLIDVQRRAF